MRQVDQPSTHMPCYAMFNVPAALARQLDSVLECPGMLRELG